MRPDPARLRVAAAPARIAAIPTEDPSCKEPTYRSERTQRSILYFCLYDDGFSSRSGGGA